MTLQFKHFDSRFNEWIENENSTGNINKPILTEELNHTLLETYFPGKSFSFAHIDEYSQVADLYKHPEGQVLLLASGERLLYGESECLETIEKICPDPTHRGAYGSLFIGACENSVYKEMNILVVDDDGKNGGILPDDVAWRQIGDCHGKISPQLAQELSGSIDQVIQHRLTIPEDFRLAKGTLAPKNLDNLPYINPNTKVNLIVPISSFKGGDKEYNPIQPGLYTKKVWLGEKGLSERGKIAISELHSSFPEGIKDVLRTLENQAKELEKIQNDPRKVALRYCEKYEDRKKYRSNTENDLDRAESEGAEAEERDDDLMYRLIKADLESGHCQLLETQKVTDELKRFLRKEWLDIAIGKSIEFDRGMLIPSKDLSEGEIYVSWINKDEEIISFRSPLLNSNGVCLLKNKFTEDALAPNGNALKGAIVISDDDHKRIQARIKALEEQGIDADEIDPVQTVLERMAADFDGDHLGVAAASDFPNLTEEVKFKNLPENAYVPTKKEAKVSFRLPDGSYPAFEEIALFVKNSPLSLRTITGACEKAQT